ncbi:MAG TPA: glycine cleavage T C-terminal barrel domain-containing protein [Tepidisphaeraceae bacterium]|nr:glycine cleavage T C-terminal barrel domain-containing protein [Tepidisphaeraceae bacterium]
MSDTRINPLLATHQQAQAELQAYGEIEIVSTFGEPQAEYAAIRKGAAMIDLPQRGILELTGKDRLPFLNNLLTNQTYDKNTKTGVSAGRGVYAFLLNAKSGRIIADTNVLELGERTLLEMDARLVLTVAEALEKYRFSEQVKFSDQVGQFHEIALHGPQALAVLSEALGSPMPAMEPLGVWQTTLFGVPTIIWRDDPAAVPGYHLIVPTEAARTIWMNLLSRFGASTESGKRSLRPTGWAAFNATRIESGRPLFGIDFDDTILPAETGQLSRAVSFTKGCYPGQEIVARMHARQQVAKQLVGIRFADDHLPMAGATVFDDQSNQIGGITSSTISPVLSNAAIALGYVKKPFIPVGSVVSVPAEGALRRGIVAALPFVERV